MAKGKKVPKYNVVSMRVSDEEKMALDELTRSCSKSVSSLMREAIQLYEPHLKGESD